MPLLSLSPNLSKKRKFLGPKNSHDWENNLTAKSYAEVKANRVKTSINTILILKAEYFFLLKICSGTVEDNNTTRH